MHCGQNEKRMRLKVTEEYSFEQKECKMKTIRIIVTSLLCMTLLLTGCGDLGMDTGTQQLEASPTVTQQTTAPEQVVPEGTAEPPVTASRSRRTGTRHAHSYGADVKRSLRP